MERNADIVMKFEHSISGATRLSSVKANSLVASCKYSPLERHEVRLRRPLPEITPGII